MKISGFTFCRNADSLYYPIKESILSALPIVDEYVVALGECWEGDNTRSIIESINSDKIKIVDTHWDIKKFPRGTVHAQQTDLAKSHCSGDWLIYLQADEVLHEKDHEAILDVCRANLNDRRVEGILFDYYHFWGDYSNYMRSHSWYEKEIRIIRNHPNIHSWVSAQSFRWYDDFDPSNYRSKKGTRKLGVKKIQARIYHYGWVRPPKVMMRKKIELDRIHSHEIEANDEAFIYGLTNELRTFRDGHPKVMAARIKECTWSVKKSKTASSMGHHKLKSRLLTFIENTFFGGRRILVSKNYRKII